VEHFPIPIPKSLSLLKSIIVNLINLSRKRIYSKSKERLTGLTVIGETEESGKEDMSSALSPEVRILTYCTVTCRPHRVHNCSG
jgi:hypothetical protein